MSKLTGIAIFALGAAVGAAASWRYLKVKYEQIAQEEIDSVKEYYAEKNKKKEEVTAIPDEEDQDESNDIKGLVDYSSVLNKTKYDPNKAYYSVTSEARTNEDGAERPYVIPPEEFGELEGYRTNSLTYYADQVLADDADHIVEDVEAVVGFDSLSHFGEYEDDSVFVRNDRRKCDYEILLSQRRYSEVLDSKPYLRGL